MQTLKPFTEFLKCTFGINLFSLQTFEMFYFAVLCCYRFRIGKQTEINIHRLIIFNIFNILQMSQH